MATRTLSIQVETVALRDVEALIIRRKAADVLLEIHYEVRKTAGGTYKRGAHKVVLDAAQKTALAAFLDSNFLRDVNTAEGL